MVNLQTLYDLLDLMCIYGISAVAQNLLVGYSVIPAVAPTGNASMYVLMPGPAIVR